MMTRAPFLAADLAELDERLFSKAQAVVAMETVCTLGPDETTLVALRHDIDHKLEPALAFARWEAERGYRSTYLPLHTAPYWNEGGLPDAIAELLELGHEIGIHNNAISEHVRTGRDPHEILDEAIARLTQLGATVKGTVAHGDRLCHQQNFINDEIFEECVRNGAVPVERKSLASHGLDYDANWLRRGYYASDSAGVLQGATDQVPDHDFSGQLHLLLHPCWWEGAFS